MLVLSADADYCPSHIFATSPDANWGLEELGQYAQDIDRAITDGERSLTPCYRKLGLALELARRQVSYRQWGKFLAHLKVDPTRASKARAIYRTFPSPTDVSRLSVKEAFRRRKRHKPCQAQSQENPTASPVGPAQDLVQFFVNICRNAERGQLEMESVSAEKAGLFLTALDAAIAELGKLRSLLHARVRR